MMVDWLHCNCCFAVPSASKPVTFFLTSCGHICCKKCLIRDDAIGQVSPDHCLVCNKQARFVEINRNMKPEAKMLFSNPKEVTSEFVQKMKMIIDFQNSHHMRISQHKAEKLQKANSWIGRAQVELNTRADAIQVAESERDEARIALEYEKRRMREMEDKLAEMEQEKKRLLINRQSPFAGGGHKQGLMTGGSAFRHPRSPLDVIHQSGRSRHQSPFVNGSHSQTTVFPSLNGPTPLGTMNSFTQRIAPRATSTPNIDAIIFDQTNACHQNRLQSNNIFGGNPGGGGMFGGGGGYHGQKSSAGGSSLKGLSTPALLGLGGGGNDGAGGLPHQQDGYFS